jgi:hypothetical protein
MYALRSVVSHKGPSAHGGHYVVNAYDASTRHFWLFDDKEVTRSSAFARKKSHKSDEVYLLVYEQLDNADRVASAAAASASDVPAYLLSEVRVRVLRACAQAQ